MSNSDSFINEVSEEVRKDVLYGYVRKYGWVAVLAVLGIVGGATWNEISKARAATEAQMTGDALIEALNISDPAERAASLSAVNAEGDTNVVTAFLTAAALQDADDNVAASQTLGALAANPDVPELYRELAAFKAAMIDTGDTAARRQSLATLAVPGGTFSLLAQEQLAFLDVADGLADDAIAKLNAIAEDAGVTQSQLQRVQTLLVALGEDIAPDAPAASQ